MAEPPTIVPSICVDGCIQSNAVESSICHPSDLRHEENAGYAVVAGVLRGGGAICRSGSFKLRVTLRIQSKQCGHLFRRDGAVVRQR